MADVLDDTLDALATEEQEEFTLNLQKKKKKRSKSIAVEAPPFSPNEGKIPAVSMNQGEVDQEEANQSETEQDYTYHKLLDRAFRLLRVDQPFLDKPKRNVLPPPKIQLFARKTMWINFAAICTLLHRTMEHVMSFFYCEFVTDGSLDAQLRFLLKGRFPGQRIESVLKKYIKEYVACQSCPQPHTILKKDPQTRISFVRCETCGSERSVTPIRSGFHATSRTDRRNAKNAKTS